MAQNLKAPAIVLKSNPVGDNHRGLCMLVRGLGLVWPLAFGVSSRKSILRGSALPYNRGVADLHYDGVHRRWRLNAFDIIETHDGLRGSLDRFYAAANCAEILLRTHGSGGDELFDLATQTFLCISQACSREVHACRAAFMWLFLTVEGLRPDLGYCGVCGRPLSLNSFVILPGGMLAHAQCSEPGSVELPFKVLPWLRNIERMGMQKALEAELEENVLQVLASAFLQVVEALIERPLRTASVFRE